MSMSPATSTFSVRRERAIDSLKLKLVEYAHPSGAVHYHLASDDEHRSFMVGFRTLPEDDKGLPHILEHAALCGSERFPVRDPFFMMLRRSLQTFMNAMTGTDLTIYLFSSQVPKDFDNLLSIYLDAAFRPRLDPLDFAQEGHRLEPKGDNLDPSVDGWERKGVVYNEMKGAMASTSRQMYHAIGRTLMRDTIYRFNSGGEPRDIPQLTHEELVAFHKRCYCPANACLVTYGALDVDELHQKFSPYLDGDGGEALAPPDLQPSFENPIQEHVDVPMEEGQDTRDVSSAMLGWLWQDCSDIDEILLGSLLSEILLGHAAAPLRLALENSGLGRSTGFSGYLPSMRNGLFLTELRGMEPDEYDKLQPLVQETLQKVVREGIPRDEIDAALHQLELTRRVVGGDGIPFGLQLCERVIESWKFDSDPHPALDPEEALTRLKEKAYEKGYLEKCLEERLIRNDDFVTLFARPDLQFAAKLAEHEAKKVGEELAQTDDAARQGLAKQATDLLERQSELGDLSCLPELLLGDVPEERKWAARLDDSAKVHCPTLHRFAQPTNGILHQICAIPLRDLSHEDLLTLPFLTGFIGNLGMGEDSYTELAKRLNRVCGGLSTSVQLTADASDPSKTMGYLIGEVWGLRDRHQDYLHLLPRALKTQRFDETGRLQELVAAALSSLHAGVLRQGNAMASSAAMRGLGGRAGLSHELSGIGRLHALRKLDQALQEKGECDLGDRCADLLTRILKAPVMVALVGDSVDEQEIVSQCLSSWDGWSVVEGLDNLPYIELPGPKEVPNTAFTIGTSVNYAAMALPGLALKHPDAPALAVACRYLTYPFLHTAIREKGGAYGSSAASNTRTASLTFSSYRDPRHNETFADIVEGFEWLRSIPDDERALREAILSVFAGLDSPGSPAGEGRSRFLADLQGRGPEVINPYRQRLLEVSAEDLRRVASTYFNADLATRAIVTSPETASNLEGSWERETI